MTTKFIRLKVVLLRTSLSDFVTLASVGTAHAINVQEYQRARDDKATQVVDLQ